LDAPEVDRHQDDQSPSSGPRRKSPQVDGKPDPGSEQDESERTPGTQEDSGAVGLHSINQIGVCKGLSDAGQGSQRRQHRDHSTPNKPTDDVFARYAVTD